MLGWRLFLSCVMILALIALFYLDAQSGSAAPWLFGLAMIVAARCAWETVHMLRARSFQPNDLLVMICTLAVVAANWFGRLGDAPPEGVAALGAPMLMYGLSVMVIFAAGAIRYREPGTNMETIGAELLCVSYVGVLLTFVAQLRWIAGDNGPYLALGSIVIATKFGDTGAYTLGRLFGKKKLIPRLSPGKTWMGFWGAVLGASLASCAWFAWAPGFCDPPRNAPAWYFGILFGLVIGIVGLAGDLCESLIKRDMGHKDSAKLMPGFGGLLDLLDSILFAGPAAYVLWLVLPL